MDRPLQLSWEGLVFSELSLARVNRELLACLAGRDDLRITLRSDAPTAFGGEKTQHIMQNLAREAAPCDVYVRHMWPPNFTRPQTQRYVHVQPWEFGALPRSWVDGVRNNVDEVWCYSTYVLSLYVNAGIDPGRLAIVPLGADPQVFRPDGPRFELPTQKALKFLFVGGTIARKGADVAVNAFLRAFKRSDDVVLIVKDVGAKGVYAHMTMRDQIIAASRQPDAPEILYSDDVVDDPGLASLYRSADVLLLPYRGEGFGLPALEAMACGTPPIVTGGGSTDDFVTEFSGWRLPSTRAPLGDAFGDEPLSEPGWMLEPDGDALTVTLRRLYDNRGEIARRAAAAAVAAHLFTWERAAAVVAERLQHLGRQPA